jgi:hypothetical protein
MENSSLIKVEQIILVLKDKQVKLSPEEARLLRDELHGLLGPRCNDVVHQENAAILIDPNAEPYPERWSLIRTGPTTLMIFIS